MVCACLFVGCVCVCVTQTVKKIFTIFVYFNIFGVNNSNLCSLQLKLLFSFLKLSKHVSM